MPKTKKKAAPKARKATPKAKKPQIGTEIEVHVILDRSGSMTSNRLGTISGYNEYLKGLRADKATKYWVSLTQFDTNGPAAEPELTVSYLSQPLADVPDLTPMGYEPRGGTPLYDAIGEVIRRVKPNGRPMLGLIITDGEENSSKEFTEESVKKLMKEKEAEGWTFVFLGANIDSYRVGRSIGTQVVNTANYQKGLEPQMFAAVADCMVDYSANRRSSGMRGQSMGEAFLNASARSAMGDTPDQAIIPPPPPAFTTGGGPVAPPPFRSPRNRKWTVRKP